MRQTSWSLDALQAGWQRTFTPINGAMLFQRPNALVCQTVGSFLTFKMRHAPHHQPTCSETRSPATTIVDLNGRTPFKTPLPASTRTASKPTKRPAMSGSACLQNTALNISSIQSLPCNLSTMPGKLATCSQTQSVTPRCSETTSLREFNQCSWQTTTNLVPSLTRATTIAVHGTRS